MKKNHNLQINKNFKFLFILSVIFLSFYNTQVFSLIDAPILNQFLSYFLSPLQYVIVICLGYLAINRTYRWKEYGKIVLYLIPLYLISGIFSIDFFNVKEYGFNLQILFIDFIKSFFWYEGRWMITTSLVLALIYKSLLNFKWFINDKAKIIFWIFITTILLVFIGIISIWFNVNMSKRAILGFNYEWIFISYRVPKISQFFVASLLFLIGSSLNNSCLTNLFKNNLLWICFTILLFVGITILRIGLRISLFHWDILAIFSVIIWIPIILHLKINISDYHLDQLIWGGVIILIFHNSFNKLYSIEFVFGILIRAIFGWWDKGLIIYWSILDFITGNIWIAFTYSLVKVCLINLTLYGFALGYNKLWKIPFNFQN